MNLGCYFFIVCFQCPVECGGGKQTRFVACVLALNDLDEQVTSHSQCDQLVMPDVEQLCNTHECVSPQQYDIDSISSNRAERTSHWRTGPWGAVSAPISLRRFVCFLKVYIHVLVHISLVVIQPLQVIPVCEHLP